MNEPRMLHGYGSVTASPPSRLPVARHTTMSIVSGKSHGGVAKHEVDPARMITPGRA